MKTLLLAAMILASTTVKDCPEKLPEEELHETCRVTRNGVETIVYTQDNDPKVCRLLKDQEPL